MFLQYLWYSSTINRKVRRRGRHALWVPHSRDLFYSRDGTWRLHQTAINGRNDLWVKPDIVYQQTISYLMSHHHQLHQTNIAIFRWQVVVTISKRDMSWKSRVVRASSTSHWLRSGSAYQDVPDVPLLLLSFVVITSDDPFVLWIWRSVSCSSHLGS